MSELELLSGISFATFAASGVFFLKFWRASNDRFFLLFCTAFWLLAIERLALLFIARDFITVGGGEVFEARAWVYLIRLSAFVTILFAVIEKNRLSKKV